MDFRRLSAVERFLEQVNVVCSRVVTKRYLTRLSPGPRRTRRSLPNTHAIRGAPTARARPRLPPRCCPQIKLACRRMDSFLSLLSYLSGEERCDATDGDTAVRSLSTVRQDLWILLAITLSGQIFRGHSELLG